MRSRWRYLAAVGVLLAGCGGGGSPSFASPSAPGLDATGIWIGSTDPGVQLQGSIVWTLTQNGAQVTGTGIVNSTLTGAIEGTVRSTGADTGTFTTQPMVLTEPGCAITVTANEPYPVNGRTITGRYTQVNSGTCAPGTRQGSFTLTRQ